MWIFLSTRNAYANKGLLGNVNNPKPVVPELSPDLRTILRSHVAEFALRSSSLMFTANLETENRHVVLRSPLEAFNIKNYRTFTHAEIVDVNAAAQLLRDDMPTITGSRTTVWPSLCAAMQAWSESFVMDRAAIFEYRTNELDTARGVLQTKFAWDMSTIEMGKRDVGEGDIYEAVRSVLC